MSDTGRNSFLLYRNFYNQFKLLSMEERGLLITAIFEYDRSGAVPEEVSLPVAMAFSCIRDAMDRDRESYEARCAVNAENGKKGGRPRKENGTSKTERFFEKPKKPNKDKDKDKDINTEKENGTDPDQDRESSSVLPSSAPPLSEQTKERLISEGLSEAYIEERAERAALYAEEHGRSVSEVLSLWWKKDRKALFAGTRRPDPPPRQASYDLEDFFRAAVARAYDEEPDTAPSSAPSSRASP